MRIFNEVTETYQQTTMTRTLKFYKEETGLWFVDLPEWTGDKEELEMIAGADKMLDVYSQYSNSIPLTVSDLPLEEGDTLIHLNIPEGSYKVSTLHSKPYDFDIWLCSVTQFVFGEYPDRIYVKRVNTE